MQANVSTTRTTTRRGRGKGVVGLAVLGAFGLVAVLSVAGCGAGASDGSSYSGGSGGGTAGSGGGTAGTGGATGGASGAGGEGGAGGTDVSPHSLGGTLSGLEGDQVVLRNNGTGDLPLTADGPFSFPDTLAPGTDYDVIVLTQPKSPTQTCTVTHGSGVMGQADVTDIQVICVTAGPFTVGGFVGGLLGTGLVLQNNGGDDLAVAASDAFTFATPLPEGAAYQVTVLQQPAGPDQTCAIVNGAGTVGGADVTTVQVTCELKDTDGDDIPDISDPFPNDPGKPVAGSVNTVYAHTSSALFTMDVNSHAIASVGAFHGSGFAGQMTDVALDEFGVLYGVTFDDLYVCDATTAACYHLAALPQNFNGLTMVPKGTLDPYQDALVGIANAGDWYRIQLVGTGQAQLTKIGAYGGSYTNAGDAFSITGVGTFAAVYKGSLSNNVIVKVDPTNGLVQSELGPTGYNNIWGLAGWEGVVFAFDAGGDVISINPTTAAVQLIAHTPHAWWGAGVTTRL